MHRRLAVAHGTLGPGLGHVAQPFGQRRDGGHLAGHLLQDDVRIAERGEDGFGALYVAEGDVEHARDIDRRGPDLRPMRANSTVAGSVSAVAGSARLFRRVPSATSRDVSVSHSILGGMLALALPAAAVSAPAAGTLRLETGARGAPVLIDGAPAGNAPLPGPWTLPPGQHTVEIRAPGQPPAKATVTIVAGQEARVELLAKAAPVQQAVAVAPSERVVYTGAGFPLATAGYITAGVGLAAGATAVLFGLNANSKAEEARNLDKSDPSHTRAQQLELVDQADRAALLANVTAGVGIVAGVAGISMVLLASDGPLGGLSLTPAPGGAGLAGTF